MCIEIKASETYFFNPSGVQLFPVESVTYNANLLSVSASHFFQKLACTVRHGANKDNSNSDRYFTHSLLSLQTLTAYTW